MVRWALAGAVFTMALVLVDMQRGGAGNPVSLVQPGRQGSASALFAQDFPELEQPDGRGLDGQAYYAIARDPFHLDQTARYLDGPSYRLQRPLLSWSAWALHPAGGGIGLILALSAVILLGLVVGGVAAGALSLSLRGPPWAAALFALTPGAYWSLRVTVSDALALALALAAVALASRNRTVLAVLLGVLAVLAKEPMVLVLIGWALHRRTRRDLWLVAVPGSVALGWMIWLHIVFPSDGAGSHDIGLPFVGLWEGWVRLWSHGYELTAMACTLGGIGLGTVALYRRGLRHPLGWMVAVQLGFMACLGVNPAATNFGGTRMAMAIMVLSALALLTPDPPDRRRASARASADSRPLAARSTLTA